MDSGAKLGKYKVVKILGKGGFANVLLVRDSNNHPYALKQIPKEDLADLEYLYQEVKIMKSLSSEYIVKFYEWQQNEGCIYILMEYCNGGDLRKDMSQMKNKFYSIEQATKILSDIIRGLEIVHSKGIIHRDIKIQNILVQIDQNGKKKYKITDFGLSKPEEKGNTVLGTASYMSPQIFSEADYGFGVDMWSFGVMFYYMLNREFPFKINPFIDDLKQKQRQLIDKAKKFSYKQFVKNSKYRKQENCNQDMEELFGRIFEIDEEKRITFAEIRKHPIFAQHFNDSLCEESKIMYNKKPKMKDIHDILKAMVSPEMQKTMAEKQNTAVRISVQKPLEGEFKTERKIIQHKNQEINFLHLNFREFRESRGILSLIEKAPLCYNLVKYYLILKKNFLRDLRSGQFLKKYKTPQMKAFSQSKEFKDLIKEIDDEMQSGIYQFQILEAQCADHLDQISEIIDKFRDSFKENWREIEFDSKSIFKRAYRQSTLYTFKAIRNKLKRKVQGNKLNYFLTLVVISHTFNRLFEEQKNFKQVFKSYLESTGSNCDNLDFGKLRQWMSKSTGHELNGVSGKIITLYFD